MSEGLVTQKQWYVRGRGHTVAVICQKAWPHGDLHSFIPFYCKYTRVSFLQSLKINLNKYISA